ncbi:MAG: SDR family oxidoreductase [Balneolaceae bacterium]|nr:SDR family oxidoreductase [Balneolaceae bacterium]
MPKYAVVTGASRGIGYQTALHLARAGHFVIGTARSEELLEQLKSEKPDRIHIYAADLTDQVEMKDLIYFINETFDEVDILVNNAGSLINKPFAQLNLDDWNAMISTNLLSAVWLIRSLLDSFSSPAHVVNISSMGGFQGSRKFPGLTAYSVAKGGLSILSECLANELAEYRVRMNTLCLGAVQTNMLEEAFPGMEAPVSSEQMGEYISNFSLEGVRYYNGKILPVALSDPDYS